jgi:hypothetical protein
MNDLNIEDILEEDPIIADITEKLNKEEVEVPNIEDVVKEGVDSIESSDSSDTTIPDPTIVPEDIGSDLVVDQIIPEVEKVPKSSVDKPVKTVIPKPKCPVQVDPDEVFGRIIVRKAKDKKSKANKSLVPIINDPEDLLEGTADPKEIAKRMFSDPTKNDTLYDLVKKDDTSTHVFKQVLKEIAEELAYLKAARKINFLTQTDSTDTSSQRIRALKSLVDMIAEREKAQSQYGGKIDFRGDRFEKVVEFFLEAVKTAFEKSGIPEQFNDIFYTQLAQDLDGFEKKVENIYYGKNEVKKPED